MQWTLSGDNETVEFSDDVKNGIINCYNDIDKNNDGNLSLAELNSREISYINIDAGSKEISLNGIENLKYLHELSIYNVRGEIDLQKLSSLPNLKRIYVSGYVTDIKNADLLNNLEELTINSWDMNYKINLDFLKKLTGLR